MFKKNLIIIILINIINGYLHEGDPCSLPSGNKGVCQPLLDCIWLHDEIRSNRILIKDLINYRCTFRGFAEISCCPIPPIVSRNPNERPSEQACSNNTIFDNSLISTNILNGVDSLQGEFRYMASLGYLNDDVIAYSCGGSLISEKYVLTAAHCTLDTNSPIHVRLGSIHINSMNKSYGNPVIYDVEKIINHPDYLFQLNYNDLALIRLTKSVIYNKDILPACLSSNNNDPEITKPMIIIGFGRINPETQEKSDILQKANVTSVPLGKCNETFSMTRKLPNGLNNGHLCGYSNLSDTCQGDSGSPIQIYLDNGMPSIVGITSFGLDCGVGTGVYTRISYYLDWIESVVWL